MKKTSKKYKSRIAATVHKTAKGLVRIGAVDKATMCDFDKTCLTTDKGGARVGPRQATFKKRSASP